MVHRAGTAAEHPAPTLSAGVFLLATATLLFEIDLTRLFSVAQFYHFAFMIVSLAMLGFGASGTWLALRPGWGQRRPMLASAVLALNFGILTAAAYLFINWIPFDSFSIAWDPRQVILLFLHYVALSLPFFCSGAVLSLLFIHYPGAEGRLYAVNLTGSALGCLLALALPRWVGAEGIVWVSAALGSVAALLMVPNLRAIFAPPMRLVHGVAAFFVVICGFLLVGRLPATALQLSPYKGLSYALQVPEARVIWRAWNSFSRVDLVASPTMRSLPGLSYRYLAPPPPQHGLFVDGDDMSPVLQVPAARRAAPDAGALAFTGYLPTAVAYRLRSAGEALILAPHGGLEVWTALNEGAAHVTAVEPNPLVAEAVGDLYTQPEVTSVLEEPRSYVRRTTQMYDLVVLALTAPYRPIRSGAYSLAEDYRYTVEAFRDYLSRLQPEGLLVFSRWVQTPPSESLRAFALIVTALEEMGGDPTKQIVAFRGYAMMTFLVKPQPFSEAELDFIRDFADDRAFDMVYAPDIRENEVNRHNVLATPVYYETFRDLLAAENRMAWYAAYPFDVRPPTDNHPFFGHFFTWSQAPQVIAELGQSWQPFGGAGYFVLVAMLMLSLLAAGLLIGLPAVLLGHSGVRKVDRPRGWRWHLVYFGLLGVGFLFIEIPLIQRVILFLGHPAYAVTTVLFALLLFSGVGSACAARFSLSHSLAALVVMIAGYALLLPRLFVVLLGLSWLARLAVTVLALAPAGFLMGMPFPHGLSLMRRQMPAHVPWAWAVNGAMAVVASVLSALIALSVGFGWVMGCGALCYGGAWIIARRWSVSHQVPHAEDLRLS